MSAQRSCSELEADEEAILLLAERQWRAIAEEIRSGREPLCLAFVSFLMFLGGLLEKIGEESEVDSILIPIGRKKLPDRKGLTELERESLATLERTWLDTAQEIRGGGNLLPLGWREFMKIIGKYLLGRAEEEPLAERHRALFQEFYNSRQCGGIIVPPLPCTDEQLRSWFAEGWNLIYEPSEREITAWLLSTRLEYRLLLDDETKIGWEVVREGRWLRVQANEWCPRVGERSYRGFTLALQPGQMILTLSQYAILWHFGAEDGALLDLNTDTMLATPYGDDGTDSIIHAYGTCALDTLTFSVGEWRHVANKHPKMGVRLAEIIT